MNDVHLSRRGVLKAGILGVGGLSLADVMRQQDLRANTESRCKSVILIWLDGGPSHLESYDPKPDAPAEVRGPFSAISSAVPGIAVSELIAGQARLMSHLALVRTLHHDNGDHFAAAHWVLTGHFGSNAGDLPQKFPSVGSYVARVKGPRDPGIPAYVGLPAAQSIYIFPGYQGAAYLGRAFEPFDVQPEQKYIGHSHGGPILRPAFLDTLSVGDAAKFGDKVGLLERLDRIERSIDATGAMESLDKYSRRALEMMMGRKAREAFDMDREDVRVRERYGPGPWGHYACMARRLVEAGVRFVTVDMPHWDHHSRLVEGHAPNMRAMDRAVSALIEDLLDRDMLDETLVMVVGEFGRTPRINNGLPNDQVPGRDHWGNCFAAMMAGGGVKGGQAIGVSNPRGEHPVERPVKPGDLLATVYALLGIDADQSFEDHSGRPRPILAAGEAIREIVG